MAILVHERAEGEKIGARVDRSPVELLGRHVLEGSNHLAFIGQRTLERPGREGLEQARRPRRVPLREAEVEQLRASLGQHDVGRLQVAVNDSVPMRVVERLGNVDGMAQDLVRLSPAGSLADLRESVSKTRRDSKEQRDDTFGVCSDSLTPRVFLDGV